MIKKKKKIVHVSVTSESCNSQVNCNKDFNKQSIFVFSKDTWKIVQTHRIDSFSKHFNPIYLIKK